MTTKMRLLEATITRFRSKALDHLTRIEIMLDNPTGVAEHVNYVDEIEENIREVMICENSINALQTYFVPPAAASPQASVAGSPPTPTAPLEVEALSHATPSKKKPT